MSPPSRTVTLIALGLISAFGPLSMDLYLPALPAIATDFDARDATTQLTMSACMVGLALGQLVFGPFSDRVGRRVPLLGGVGAFAVLSVACAFAPTMGILVALRFIQGLAGSAGIVIARAVVRDRFEGDDIARAFSLLMLVNGLAPIISPLLGGQLLRVMPWPGLFLSLAAIGVGLLLLSSLTLPESLPSERRHSGGGRDLARAFATVARDRVFVGAVGVLAFAGSVLFVYIALSSFVFQHEYGLSPSEFSMVFATNGIGIMLGTRTNSLLLRRFHIATALTVGLSIMGAAVLVLLLATHLGWGLVAVLPALFVAVGSIGFVFPNTSAIALVGHPRNAGTASALLGTTQFLAGAVAGPLASLRGASAVAMANGMAVAMVGVVLILVLVVHPTRRSSAVEHVSP
jgi:DHA1 family bicyclomycin/chloramphenicol resistance-like MFS transporter